MKSSDSAYISAMLSEDSGLRLLRTKNAALTISFLYKIFRKKHIQTISADRFETLRADFLRDQEMLTKISLKKISQTTATNFYTEELNFLLQS